MLAIYLHNRLMYDEPLAYEWLGFWGSKIENIKKQEISDKVEKTSWLRHSGMWSPVSRLQLHMHFVHSNGGLDESLGEIRIRNGLLHFPNVE